MADSERWKALKQDLWGDVIEELDMRISMELGKLRICAPELLKTVQDKINFLEEMKRLPDQVIDREE